jgi:acetyl esterase/lipase
VAGDDLTTPSYQENADQALLGKADMQWFVDHVFKTPGETADPRLDLVARNDLSALPPATVNLAEYDPLRSEGETYTKRLRDAGVEVEVRVFLGDTHEFSAWPRWSSRPKRRTTWP